MQKDDDIYKSHANTGEHAAPVADMGDSIARNRTLTFPTADQVPGVPQGYKLTPIETQRARLRWVPEDMTAEFLAGLEELGAKSPAEVRADLGEFAPDTSGVPAIVSKIKSLDATILELETTLAACRELRTIHVSDGKVILDKAHDQLRKRTDDLPNLPTRYPSMERFYGMQVESIREGRKRAKQARSARTPDDDKNK